MRLCFVLETFARGGKERRCLQLIQGLNKFGITDIKTIIINGSIEYDELFSTSSEIVNINRKEKKLSIFRTLNIVRKEIIAFNPDIVLSWGGFSATLVILSNIKAKHVSAFVADTIGAKKYTKAWIINKLIFKRCAKIIGNSRNGLKAYKVPSNLGIVIPNGFNEARIPSQEINVERLKKELNIATKYVIVMISRYTRQHKDYQAFIDAARKLHEVRKDVTYIGIGSHDSEREYFESQLSDKEKTYIYLWGYRKNVEQILKISDISMLFSNLNAGEGISNTIMESMALGVPVIATNGGGSPEIISHKYNGFLVNRNDINEIIEYTNLLLDDKQLYETISKNGITTIKNEFSLERMVKSYIELFKEVSKK